ETFRLCQEYLDDIVTVDSDAICAAMKDLFEDVRAVAEPSGALMSKLKGICAGMGDPIAAQITSADFSQYREGRLKGEIPDVNGR
ncbi:hypothetical protein ONJ16_27045, partial [Salmonella enterica subsp. enterica serovar Montevideo]|nr:hypothetical protein [Salmonella enterica subsp. enterica serovar Montevideo]